MIKDESEDPYWFTTFTGKKFYPFSPRIEDIDIVDIAHALSLVCRFGGHLPEHYSVAQHSVLVSYLVPTELSLEGLIHDAAEAYIGDIIRPIKKHPQFKCFLDDIEMTIESLIDIKFNLFKPGDFNSKSFNDAKKLIKKVDNIALLTEKRDLFKAAWGQNWGEVQGEIGNSPSPIHTIKYMHPAMAEQQFMHRYEELKRT